MFRSLKRYPLKVKVSVVDYSGYKIGTCRHENAILISLMFRTIAFFALQKFQLSEKSLEDEIYFFRKQINPKKVCISLQWLYYYCLKIHIRIHDPH